MQLKDVRRVEWDEATEAIERCYELGWTDGLPVVPPTIERVQEFITYVDRSPDEVLGRIDERRREVSVAKAASNAVMAGCLPEYFPIVVAATEAMLDPTFNLIAPSSSQGGASLLVIVNGPVIGQLGINCKDNLFGPGNRANATIGRATRLIMMNACASIPGLFDRSIMGDPSKYTFCIGENEDESPWEPLHVDRGFAREESTVTVFASWGPRQLRAANEPKVVLDVVADVASSLGTSLATSDSVSDLTIGVRQGQVVITFAGAGAFWNGWTKQAVKEYLHPRIGRSVADLKKVKVMKGTILTGDEDRRVNFVPEPDDILVIFAGSPEASGYRSSVILSELPKVASTAVTKAVRLP